MTDTLRSLRRSHRSAVRVLVAAVAVLLAIALAAPASANVWRFEDLDGPGVPGGNGRTAEPTGDTNATIVWNNQPHVFYRSDTTERLRHAWWDGRAWRFEDLDGIGVPGGNGRADVIVGFSMAATVWSNQPHVFYSVNAAAQTMRHAWWDGRTWRFEYLDGPGVPGGNGRVANNVASITSATVWSNQPHVFYRDVTALRLRHAWWDGRRWLFENLDGIGVPGGNGRANVSVGFNNSVTVWSNQPHVFYNSATGRLRHAWWDGRTWRFEDLDGPGVPGGNGRVGEDLGGRNAVTVWSNQPHVFYDSNGGRLRHGWWDGRTWRFEDLDGPGVPGGNGRTANAVGREMAVTVWRGTPHVWYEDFEVGRLRHGWWDGRRWLFENLDGPGVPGGNGRTATTIATTISVTVWRTEPHVFYVGLDPMRLRHAWYG